jgi:glycosyltransferase involved in cell wall biosynthesis
VPNHYQCSFFAALRDAGVDLQVRYYQRVRPDRLKMGWREYENLPSGEQYLSNGNPLATMSDWEGRIHAFSACNASVLWQMMKTLSKRGVYWVHWSEPSHPGLRRLASLPLKRRYGRWINQHALGALGVGERALSDFSTWGVRTEKTALLTYSGPACNPNATPDETCASFKGSRLAILYLGALCHRKGTDTLLRAFAIAAKGRPDAVLILVGNDQSKGRYQSLAERLQISRQVLFRGPVSPDSLDNVLRCGDVFCLPSRHDGWGVVLNEAASMGLAIVATDGCGASFHLVASGENGFRVRAGSVQSLASALKTYVNEPALARAHGAVSRELHRSYTPAANTRRFLSAIHAWQAMG